MTITLIINFFLGYKPHMIRIFFVGYEPHRQSRSYESGGSALQVKRGT